MANIVLDFLHNYQTGERRESEPANAYQYDEGHVLEAVLPEVITSCEIHYWIRGMEEADAYTPTSITPNSDGSCTVLGNIPNSYFETNGELRIYIVVTDGTASITTYEGKLHIAQRARPDDYVDDDPENDAVQIIAAARGYAETSEAWAVGQINGEDVPSTADQYQNNAAYYANQAAAAASSAAAQASLAPAYNNTATYEVGDYCLYSGQLYECNTAISTAEAWTAAHWTAVTVGGELSSLKKDLDDVETALETKAEIDGYYEEMTVGDAEQLVSTVTNADDTPYNFRTTAGSADVGDRAYVDAIVGGTVALNQLVDSASIPATKTESGVTFTNNGDGTITVNGTATADIVYAVNPQKTWSDHKYMISGCPKGGSTSTYNLAMRGMGADLFDTGNGNLWNATGNAWKGAVIYIKSGATVTNLVFKPNIFDLTQIFGTTIADYVYGLETATAGAGVAWLKANAPKIFNGEYIPFNAGTLQSVVGLSEKRNTGLNQWDEEWEAGYYDANGLPVSNYTTIRSKNYIRVIPNTEYYYKAPNGTNYRICYFDANKNFIYRSDLLVKGTTFTTPSNCHFIMFHNDGATYNHDICINLHWDGEKDGTYEPYTVHTYAFDPTVELRGVPKLKDGKMYFDGDEYLPDGTVNRRYGVVDLGTLEWHAISGYAGYFKAVTTEVVNIDNEVVANALCPKYVTVKGNDLASKDKVIAVGMNNAYEIQIGDSAYSTASASDFRNALAGVMLLYKKRLFTTETAEPYQHVQICDDFGTEEYVTTSLVPVGHETRYAPNLRAKLEMSPDSPDGDGLYIVQQSGGENTYIPLASSTTIQNILARLTALEGNTNEG